MERRILHIDMDAFFASVEQVLNPSLRGKPLIIGGGKQDTRGVVSTASYEARVFGVHSAMPIVEARRLCPHGIFMRGSFAAYKEASDKVREILQTVSPSVQMASIDEAYVDVSGSQRLFGGDDAIADYIKSAIRRETQLPCSVAITPNKLVSKVGSDEAKPDGYLRVAAGDEQTFLAPLSLRKLPGAGPKICERLEALGLTTVGELATAPLDLLMKTLGQTGYALQRTARGISTSEVVPERVPKSIGRETTFEKDLKDWERIEQILSYLTERTTYALREKGMEARRVTLKVRHSDFSTHTYAKTLREPTTLDIDIVEALRELIPKGKARRARVRLIGVTLSLLTHNQHQLHLFGRAGSEKWERVLERVDAVRDRHGFECLRSAKSMALGRDVRLATPSLSR
ncbi:MAG: DNA polymerase IV [Candidatus Hydrogenedentes bacterium]|nr:DNA polymerase IV [Candidatus Hydrogenedentota bacterium]